MSISNSEDITHRPDLRDHPDMQSNKPSPIGIAAD